MLVIPFACITNTEAVILKQPQCLFSYAIALYSESFCIRRNTRWRVSCTGGSVATTRLSSMSGAFTVSRRPPHTVQVPGAASKGLPRARYTAHSAPRIWPPDSLPRLAKGTPSTSTRSKAVLRAGGLDEHSIPRLNPVCDGYGVGTSISSAPDA